MVVFFKVENLVCIELAYINTKHPDFTEASVVHRALTESMEPDLKKMNIRDNIARQPAAANLQGADDVVSNNASKRVVCWAFINSIILNISLLSSVNKHHVIAALIWPAIFSQQFVWPAFVRTLVTIRLIYEYVIGQYYC